MFIPTGENIKNKIGNGFIPTGEKLYTGNEPQMIGGMILDAIPGLRYAWNTKNQSINPINLFKEASKDVVNTVKSLPGFLASAVYTPALTISEAFGGPKKLDLSFAGLGQQKSFKTQRQEIKQAGGGEVMADVMPIAQWGMAVAGVKKVVDVTNKIGQTLTPKGTNVRSYIQLEDEVNDTPRKLVPVGEDAQHVSMFDKNKGTVGSMVQGKQAADLTKYERAYELGDTRTLDNLMNTHMGDPRFSIHDRYQPPTKPINPDILNKFLRKPGSTAPRLGTPIQMTTQPISFTPLIPGVNIPDY